MCASRRRSGGARSARSRHPSCCSPSSAPRAAHRSSSISTSRAMRFLKSWVLFGVGALALLAVLEGALRVLPTYSGLQPSPAPEDYPLRGYEASRPYKYSYGWAMLNAHGGMTNNYGHVAPFDFRTGSRPLIVAGDSYI